MQQKLWRAASLCSAAALLAMGVSAAPPKPLKIGQAAPQWNGKTIAGKAIQSKELKGKAVLMNFFGFT